MTSSPSPKAGVVGWPIKHSLSPRVHGFWLKKLGLAGSYDLLPVEPSRLETFLRSMPQNHFVGVNLTIPHKVAACSLVDSLDFAAQRVGAVNLVVVDKTGQLGGFNTDVFGFEQNLVMAGYHPTDGDALVLGAGGAARAVLVALQNMGVKRLVLANRTRDRAEKLAQELTTPQTPIDVIDWQQIPQHLADTELLVNATSLGMTGQPALALDLQKLPPKATVTDIVYTPLQTDLLRHAAQHGCKTIDGLGMLLHQARPSFKAFFGRDPTVTPELRNAVLREREEP